MVQRKGFRVVCIVDGVCVRIYGRCRGNGLNGRGVWCWGSVCWVGGRTRHYDGVGDGVGDGISSASVKREECDLRKLHSPALAHVPFFEPKWPNRTRARPLAA